MSSKTPVSILQEMCVRRGSPPHYNLIHDGGGTHAAIFKYCVHYGDIYAIGSGRSKKEAKHDAAKNLLERMKDQGEEASSPEPIAEEAIDVGDVTSPYWDKVRENAVGALQELCSVFEIQSPIYDLVADEGPPHAKQFTIRCLVSRLEETACARTKKQAKQLAAQKMVKRLKTSIDDSGFQPKTDPADGENKVENDPNFETVVNKYKEFGTISAPCNRVPLGQKISEYHLLLRGLSSDLLEKVKAHDPEVELAIKTDPCEFLNSLLEELKLEADYYSVESVHSYMVILSITTSSQTSVFGRGSTLEAAKAMAAEAAIAHLKLMST